jgi:anthranilate synthase component 2
MKLLIVDNYDSFTFNLVELIRKIGISNYEVIKSDGVLLDNIKPFNKILFTPGPGLPNDYPAMFNIIEKYAQTKSILGICLGHQAIAQFYGAQLINMNQVMHGITKDVKIIETGEPIFYGCPKYFQAGLYHSWYVSKENFPEELTITAISNDGIIMALSHKKYDVRGLQFHPESIMTPNGTEFVKNWLLHNG